VFNFSFISIVWALYRRVYRVAQKKQATIENHH